MSLIRQLGTNSGIYAATNMLQKGTAFLLLPLYTRHLDPDAYGVLAIVTAINGLLAILFTLGLTGAVTRFYFEYQDDPVTLAEFWGSVLSVVLVLSAVLAGTLLLFGEWLLKPLLGDVPFWPFVALGVVATFFQPFLSMFLAVLQMRNQAGRYAAVSLANFGLTTVLTVLLVVVLGYGVGGALTATLVAAALFFVVSLWMLRRDIRFCVRWRHLRPAFGYSLPLVPHSIAGQATAFADRMVLNSFLGTAAAGLYSVGAMIAMVVEVAAQSINRAYVPISMAALKRGKPDDLVQIEALGTLTVAAFCLLGAAVATYATELVRVLASPDFAAAAEVVPILVFGGVANGIYLLFVNALFFERRAVGLIPIGTLTAGVASVASSLLLVPTYGPFGAAAGALLAQTIATVLIATLARRHDPVRWPYLRYAAAFLSTLALAYAAARIDAGGWLATAALKAGALGALLAVLGGVLWGRPSILGNAVVQLLRRRPDRAAALFLDTRIGA